jgi:hypothetical protein
MIGGSIIIPIRGVNGEKIVISSTAQNLKPGIYDRVIRAINMQKQLIFNDINIINVGPASSGATVIIMGLDSSNSYRISCSFLTSAGVLTTANVVITKDNQIKIVT